MKSIQMDHLESRLHFAAVAKIVKDIAPGSESGIQFGGDFVKYKDAFYFTANDGEHGSEVWKSNGKSGQTTMLKDINSNQDSFSSPFGYQVLDGLLYFQAEDVDHGRELWVTDGTPDGTQLVRDFDGASTSSFTSELSIKGKTAFLTATDSDGKTNLYRLRNGKVKKVELPESIASPIPVSIYKDRFYFEYLVTDDATELAEIRDLWSVALDGTDAKRLTRVAEKPATRSLSGVGPSIVFKKKLYFFTHLNGKDAVWRTDGTKSGTKKAFEIETVNLSTFCRVRDRICFFVPGDTNVVMSSDGTQAGTRKLFEHTTDVSNGAQSSITAVIPFKKNGYVLTSTAGVQQLWKTDGTKGGTKVLKELGTGARNTSAAGLVAISKRLYFTAFKSGAGQELWRSNGTAKSTKMICDVIPGSAGSDPGQAFRFKGNLYFIAGIDLVDDGRELYKLDLDDIIT